MTRALKAAIKDLDVMTDRELKGEIKALEKSINEELAEIEGCKRLIFDLRQIKTAAEKKLRENNEGRYGRNI